MQEWLNNKSILMHSTHNEGTSVITERLTKALTVKIYKKQQPMITNLIFYFE